jgi:hypothetical protein
LNPFDRENFERKDELAGIGRLSNKIFKRNKSTLSDTKDWFDQCNLEVLN